MTVYHGMPVNLPKAASGQPTRDDSAAITLARDGQTYLNREPTTREAPRRPAPRAALGEPEPRGDDQRRRRGAAPPRRRRGGRGPHGRRRARGDRGRPGRGAAAAMRAAPRCSRLVPCASGSAAVTVGLAGDRRAGHSRRAGLGRRSSTPERFTDIKDGASRSDDGHGRRSSTSSGGSCARAGKRYVPAGLTLEIRVTDVDLAGEFEPGAARSSSASASHAGRLLAAHRPRVPADGRARGGVVARGPALAARPRTTSARGRCRLRRSACATRRPCCATGSARSSRCGGAPRAMKARSARRSWR